MPSYLLNRSVHCDDLVAGIAADVIGVRDCQFSRIIHDSRQAQAQACFVALVGQHVDGHRFAAQVVAQGCTGLVLAREQWPTVQRELALAGVQVPTVIVVDDTAAVLADLAGNAWGWPGRQLHMAGITGTNGKSTTTHLLSSIFAAHALAYVRLGTTGHWVVDRELESTHTTPFPLELAELLAHAVAQQATHATMEVASHALIQRRVAGLRFRAVALTSFSQDHLDFHPDMAAYLAAKCLLASDYLTDDGIAIAHEHTPGADAFLASARRAGHTAWTIAHAPATGHLIVRESIRDRQGSRALVETPQGTFTLCTTLLGDYNLDNALMAFACALAMGLSPQPTLEALAQANGAPGRLERVDALHADDPTVLVDYAHTPDAVERALQAVRPYVSGKLWIVVGCGGDRDRGKRPLMAAAAERLADVVIATSDNPRTEDPQAILRDFVAGLARPDAALVQPDRRLAIQHAIVHAQAGDMVLIAGKGHESYQILGTTKHPFDDRVEAQQALRLRQNPS